MDLASYSLLPLGWFYLPTGGLVRRAEGYINKLFLQLVDNERQMGRKVGHSLPHNQLDDLVLRVYSPSRVAQWMKNPPADAGDGGWFPASGRSLRKGNGNPLQYSRLENSTDRGALWVAVHGAAKCQTRLSTHAHMVHSPALPPPVFSPFGV